MDLRLATGSFVRHVNFPISCYPDLIQIHDPGVQEHTESGQRSGLDMDQTHAIITALLSLEYECVLLPNTNMHVYAFNPHLPF